GTLKNALDWLVRSGELYEKPVALINLSPRSNHAQASLAETLSTMTARIIPEACLTLPLSARDLDVPGICRDPAPSQGLSAATAALVRAVASTPSIIVEAAHHNKLTAGSI